MSKILIIMPAYNEAGSIGDVITAIKNEVSDADILVVNDGSRDNTGKIARGLNADVIDLPYNMGIGVAMQTGYKYALLNDYNVAIQVDADGQHPPDQINHLISSLVKGDADLVIGSRFLGSGEYQPSLARNIGIRIFSMVISLITGQRLTDTTSGFRAANKRVINFFARNYPEDYPEVEALVLLRKARFNIMEIPIRMKARTAGQSSITPLHAIYYMIKVLLAVFIDILKKVER